MNTRTTLWSAACLAFATLGAAGFLTLAGALPGTRITGANALLWKVIGTSVVLMLAGAQVLLAARLWRATSFPAVSERMAAGLHRVLGRVTIAVAVVVAVSCITGPAGPTSPARVLTHSILGSLVFVILSAKILVLRVLHRGGDLLPWLGGSLFLTFGAVWATSVADYIAAR